MHAFPAALSVAASPNHESWWPPTMTKSSLAATEIRAVVIWMGRQPFSTCVRSHTRTGPWRQSARRRSPSVRAIPMQGSVGISVATLSDVGLPHAGLTDPNGTARLSGAPQFIITQPAAPKRPAIRCFSWRAGW